MRNIYELYLSLLRWLSVSYIYVFSLNLGGCLADLPGCKLSFSCELSSTPTSENPPLPTDINSLSDTATFTGGHSTIKLQPSAFTAAVVKPANPNAPGCYLCTHCYSSNGYHIPTKRACRSLSASSSMMHPMLLGVHCPNVIKNAVALEAHRNSLPRPIAIRLTPVDKVSSMDVGGTLTRSTVCGVSLRPRPREVNRASRLSWHHPLFTIGIDSKAQHPSYGVHFVCPPSGASVPHPTTHWTTSRAASSKVSCGLPNSSATLINLDDQSCGQKCSECVCQTFSQMSRHE